MNEYPRRCHDYFDGFLQLIPKSGIGTFRCLVPVRGGEFYSEHLFFCCFLVVFSSCFYIALSGESSNTLRACIHPSLGNGAVYHRAGTHTLRADLCVYLEYCVKECPAVPGEFPARCPGVSAVAFGPSSRRPQSCREAERPASGEGEGAPPSSRGPGARAHSPKPRRSCCSRHLVTVVTLSELQGRVSFMGTQRVSHTGYCVGSLRCQRHRPGAYSLMRGHTFAYMSNFRLKLSGSTSLNCY